MTVLFMQFWTVFMFFVNRKFALKLLVKIWGARTSLVWLVACSWWLSRLRLPVVGSRWLSKIWSRWWRTYVWSVTWRDVFSYLHVRTYIYTPKSSEFSHSLILICRSCRFWYTHFMNFPRFFQCISDSPLDPKVYVLDCQPGEILIL